MQNILELLDADVAELISVKQREGVFDIFNDVDWQLNTAVLTVFQLEDVHIRGLFTCHIFIYSLEGI